MEVGKNTLVVLLHDVFRDPLHSEYLNVEACAVGEGVVDSRQVFLVNLAQMHAQPSCCVESAPASFAFEMFCLLVIDEDLEVVEVALTVVTPRPRQDLFDVRVVSLFLGHLGRRIEGRALVVCASTAIDRIR